MAAVAGVLVLLVAVAAPVWAVTQPTSKAAERFVEALGFADVGEFRTFFGLDENGKGDYADSSSSIDADALAKWLPPNGFTGKVHHLDARVGGTFRMSFTNFTTGHAHSFGGTYVELV